jgi:hypothetical protein
LFWAASAFLCCIYIWLRVPETEGEFNGIMMRNLRLIDQFDTKDVLMVNSISYSRMEFQLGGSSLRKSIVSLPFFSREKM